MSARPLKRSIGRGSGDITSTGRRSSPLPGEVATPGLSAAIRCLGKTFASDAQRREHFQGRLRTGLEELFDALKGVRFSSVEDTVARLSALKIWPLGGPHQIAGLAQRLREDGLGSDLLDRYRCLTGFPEGEIGDILSLSDPPFFTACPNPFLAELVAQLPAVETHGNLRHRHEGQALEFHCTTRHPVYAFHPYHTKVPPGVVRRLIEHYSEPGEIVLDGFCGSGMTGVAARAAGRVSILADLCPAAGFIAGVNNRSHALDVVLEKLERILAESEQQWGHLYQTLEGGEPKIVNYYVWSDVFVCPGCAREFPMFPHGVIQHPGKVETRKSFPCPSCGIALSVRRVRRRMTGSGKKKQLVWVNAGKGAGRIARKPSAFDLALADRSEACTPASWYPCDPIDAAGYTARLAQLGDKAITDVSRLLSKRNLTVFADLWERVSQILEPSCRNVCRATLTSVFTVVSERQGYFGGGGGMSGNLYMPIIRMEKNVFQVLRRKLSKLIAAERSKRRDDSMSLVSTQSAGSFATLPDGCIDYIYVDPPFGANIIYSEMNLPLEAWLRLRTRSATEAVVDETRDKGLEDYGRALLENFGEFHRLLKPGRWITIEFHNAKATIWNLFQEAIVAAGFVVSTVGVCDKGSTTILMDIRPGAARHDLLICAYKPVHPVRPAAILKQGREEDVWEFVKSRLEELDALPHSAQPSRARAERRAHLLFDRMVADHIKRCVTVPISAADFYAGLSKRFARRGGLYFVREPETAGVQRKG